MATNTDFEAATTSASPNPETRRTGDAGARDKETSAPPQAVEPETDTAPLSRDCHDDPAPETPRGDVGAAAGADRPLRCPYCQAPASADARVCSSCGCHLTGCKVCGAAIPAGAGTCEKGHFQAGNRKAWKHGQRAQQHPADLEEQLLAGAEELAAAWGIPLEPYEAELLAYVDIDRRIRGIRGSDWAKGQNNYKAAAKLVSTLTLDLVKLRESVMGQASEAPNDRDERAEQYRKLSDSGLFQKALHVAVQCGELVAREDALERFTEARDQFLPLAEVVNVPAPDEPAAVEAAPIDVLPEWKGLPAPPPESDPAPKPTRPRAKSKPIRERKPRLSIPVRRVSVSWPAPAPAPEPAPMASSLDARGGE